MPTSLCIQQKVNQITTQFFLFVAKHGILLCYNLPFSDGGMVMWTTTHCFYFLPCNLMYLFSICKKLLMSSASPSILIKCLIIKTCHRQITMMLDTLSPHYIQLFESSIWVIIGCTTYPNNHVNGYETGRRILRSILIQVGSTRS